MEFLEFRQIYSSKCVSQECFVLPHDNSSRVTYAMSKNLILAVQIGEKVRLCDENIFLILLGIYHASNILTKYVGNVPDRKSFVW